MTDEAVTVKEDANNQSTIPVQTEDAKPKVLVRPTSITTRTAAMRWNRFFRCSLCCQADAKKQPQPSLSFGRQVRVWRLLGMAAITGRRLKEKQSF